MTDCPCCGYPMVHCFRYHQTVSFCRHCWQEMPDLTAQNTDALLNRRSLERALHQRSPQPLLLAP